MSGVEPLLRRLLAETDATARLAADPVSFVHRYTDRADREVMAVFAAGLAFGRVAAFFPVLKRISAAMDEVGGPARSAAVGLREGAIDGLFYRWVRAPDLLALLAAVGAVQRVHGSLEVPQREGSAREGLTALVAALRAELPATASKTRGLVALLSSPADGSACKRWCMFHRWMVRRDAVDLGLWARPPSTLVIPVDTHVLRLSRLLGLTARSDASWRTAEEITASLRAFDPEDPVRFDFALAHLGISGACRGRYVADVCPSCPLLAGCRAAASPDP
jgi:uncharacterized protein (TIGR02757 family)